VLSAPVPFRLPVVFSPLCFVVVDVDVQGLFRSWAIGKTRVKFCGVREPSLAQKLWHWFKISPSSQRIHSNSLLKNFSFKEGIVSFLPDRLNL
jgi:hypothetical protein